MQELVLTFKEQPWNNKNYYANWLAQSYYYTSYSTRMLAFAAGSSDRSEKTYFKRSIIHISEEQGHEIIALNDLGKLGFKIEEFEELSATRSMWESQFYRIQKDSTYLLGYILALEVLAVQTKEFYGHLKDLYPAEALKFIKIHADEDPHHVEEALTLISGCTDAQKKQIELYYAHTIDMYRLILSEVNRATTQK